MPFEFRSHFEHLSKSPIRANEEPLIVTGSTVRNYVSLLLGVVKSLRPNLIHARFKSSQFAWRGIAVACLLAIVLSPISGCQRNIFGLFKLTSAANLLVNNPDFDVNIDLDSRQPDMVSRSMEQLNRKNDGVADVMLQREQQRERQLAADGLVKERLQAAGIETNNPDELIGIVVDADLRPIRGAKIVEDGCCAEMEATSDDQGIFRVGDFNPECGFVFRISKQGYSPRIIADVGPESTRLLVILGTETCFQGVVTDSDGHPVNGARIIATCGRVQTSSGSWSREFSFETTSDEDGKYRLDVCSNRFDLKVTAPGVGVARHSHVLVHPNQSVEQPIQLEKGIRFEAIVVDSETGKPFEGFVLFTDEAPKANARSDALGRLLLEDQFPGVIEFRCGAGDKFNEGAYEYWQTGSLGRWWSPDALHMHEKLHSGRQTYAFDANHKETWITWQDNRGALTFDLKPGINRVKIVVEQGAVINGTVTDPNGNPVEGATVTGVLSGTSNSLGNLTKATTDSHGCYRVILPASHQTQYHLMAHDGDHLETRTWANGLTKPLKTKPGQVIENVDIELTAPGMIRGRITSLGEPVAGRTVRAMSYEGNESPHYTAQAESTEDGTFELKHVRPGRHYVQADGLHVPATFDPKGFRIVAVRPGEVTENVEWDFKGN